jgi:hypothetical protein
MQLAFYHGPSSARYHADVSLLKQGRGGAIPAASTTVVGPRHFRRRWRQPIDGAGPWGPVVPLVTRCDAEMPHQCKTFSAVDRSQGFGRSLFVLESRITFQVTA